MTFYEGGKVAKLIKEPDMTWKILAVDDDKGMRTLLWAMLECH